jgi:2-amino-1-hydroxyethylphosphonate dioxygenase (glycine-forming)
MPPPSASDQLLSLLAGASDFYAGESVTQCEHALQCAQRARDERAGDELILAALLHDIGHLLHQDQHTGAPHHDREGARYLQELGASPRVCALVASHVDAKRYLTWAHPDYYRQLSPASQDSLRQQGGPMSADEARQFEADPLFREKLRLRAWDEQAKVPGAHVTPLAHYRPLLEHHFAGTTPGAVSADSSH